MSLKAKLSIVRELGQFLWAQKMWWMVPLVVVVLIFGVFVIFAQNTAVAPFIYVLF